MPHHAAQAFIIHPVPIGERASFVYVDRGTLERDGHTVVVVQGEDSTAIPLGMINAIILGPGTTVTHAAVSLCAKERVTLLWCAEMGVWLYACGNPRSDGARLVRQCVAHADPSRRLRVARRIFERMFGCQAPANRSIEQLRGLEGARVRQLYQELADQYAVEWEGRSVSSLDRPIDAALAGVNAALYGLCEACILVLGYSPAVGFSHSGDARSFVFDVADCLKFKTVVPLAFELAKDGGHRMEHRSRVACRDLFMSSSMGQSIVEVAEDLIDAADRH